MVKCGLVVSMFDDCIEKLNSFVFKTNGIFNVLMIVFVELRLKKLFDDSLSDSIVSKISKQFVGE